MNSFPLFFFKNGVKETMDEILLRAENLSKAFGENTVLKDINFTIKPGEIVGLVGENGAGKSTLMKIIFGMEVIQATGGYGGKLEFEGKEVHFSSPFEALEAGIGMVHQEFSLIPGFEAGENIVLNRESTKKGISEYLFGDRIRKINEKENLERARNAIEQLGVEQLRAETPISEMPVAHKQFTEIAREIEREKTKLLVLDEPTAVLTEEEAKVLISTMKTLSEKGIAIIFITHRLQEILDVSDKIIVLRDGVLINTVETENTNVNQITEWMIGRKMAMTEDAEQGRKQEAEDIIEIKDLWVDMPGEMVKKLSLTIKKGEILGLGGMAGQGKIGIANGVMGLYDAGGEVLYAGEPLAFNQPKEVLSKGIFFVSEDRKGVGLLLEDSIEKNIAYPALQIKQQFLKKQFGFFQMLDEKAVTENAKKYIEKLEIRCISSKQLVKELSGGNQQKVCLAKAFTMEPEVLFVSEPTRGIDIGAKQLVLETLKEYNQEKGTTIIITSSEIEELRSICDRIAVINEGKVAGILSPKADILEFGKLMIGAKEGGKEQ
ncbi:simple sugar transport system ATP-binding protein [Fusobacterium necrophorum]|uniref:Sugar ABC transporter ATP-binding protein n=2 Tax=Fusobacterium necrophorum TaxID=859 RepID=A0AB73BW12_9FUSO|nr:sugar ABC transporter ATP-binding protein [Fusobacterium necrophorum BL]SDB24892.1 simple sugar transport system ATP-binding protein [Fusobacterium necrophorum]SQD09586.1 Ribose import ATP-binding protein RbsA [Fusobacterium necrophorum subsp. necrophorum]